MKFENALGRSYNELFFSKSFFSLFLLIKLTICERLPIRTCLTSEDINHPTLLEKIYSHIYDSNTLTSIISKIWIDKLGEKSYFFIFKTHQQKSNLKNGKGILVSAINQEMKTLQELSFIKIR